MRTRREFIKQSLLAGAAMNILSGCRRKEKPGLSTPDVDPQLIRFFAQKLNGKVLTPTDSAYDAARKIGVWNPSTEKHPLLIAQCADADDVARSIEFAREQKLVTAVRSGGHSFIGWSTCDGMVIDLSLMKSISVDPSKRVAIAGSGVLAHELVGAGAPLGLAPVLGECGMVGVAGLTLGGGLGWLSGLHGAACDNLLSANLTTLDSKSIPVSKDINSDLFWAIRGGGGNFGVATSFEFRLHPVKNVYAGGLTYDMKDAAAVLRFYREFMATAPDALQSLAFLYPAEKPALNVIHVYVGDDRAGEKLLQPFTTIAKVIRNTMQRRLYTETFTMPPYGEFAATNFGATKGTYMQHLSDDAIRASLESFSTAPAGCALGFDHYMHGEVCRTAPDATAFNLRTPGALHVWVAAAWNNGSDAEHYMNWAADTWRALQPYTGGRVYSNYVGHEVASLQDAVFASAVTRLSGIKKQYDPDNFLRLNHNILPG